MKEMSFFLIVIFRAISQTSFDIHQLRKFGFDWNDVHRQKFKSVGRPELRNQDDQTTSARPDLQTPACQRHTRRFFRSVQFWQRLSQSIQRRERT